MSRKRNWNSLKTDLIQYGETTINGCKYVEEANVQEDRGKYVKCITCYNNTSTEGLHNKRQPWLVKIFGSRKESIDRYQHSKLTQHEKTIFHKFSVNKSSPSPTKPYDFNHTTWNGILPHCDIMSDKIQHGLQAEGAFYYGQWSQQISTPS